MTMPLARTAAAALAAVVLAGGCASPSGIAPVSTMRPPASVGLGPAAAAAPAVAPDWWKDFGDAELDRLMALALQDNPGLRAAQARLARARAVLEVAGAATLPQAEATADVRRQRYTGTGAVPAPLAGSVRETGTLQIGASWEIDFFGRYREALEGALGANRAAEAEVEAARVLLASNVARAYVQVARLDDQVAVAQRTIEQREHQLRLIADRVRAGLDTTLEMRQGEGGVAEARQQLEALREQRQLAANALAALVGQPQLAMATRSTATLRPVAVPAALPADLLGRRADIVAARWRVEAATHDMASAKAQFYPNVNLAAFVGLSSIGLGRLLDAGSLQWGVGPALRLPLFDAGRLRANLRGKAADVDLAVESYNAALTDAVRDVADQLATAQSLVRQQADQRAAQSAAEAAYDIAQQRYRAGLGTYLHVLAAEGAVLAQRRLGVDLRARTLDNQMQLMRALGGGFEADAAARQLAQTPARKDSPP